MVRATVLDDGISHFYFPFEHADHKLSIKQELSTAIWYGCKETESITHWHRELERAVQQK